MIESLEVGLNQINIIVHHLLVYGLPLLNEFRLEDVADVGPVVMVRRNKLCQHIAEFLVLYQAVGIVAFL